MDNAKFQELKEQFKTLFANADMRFDRGDYIEVYMDNDVQDHTISRQQIQDFMKANGLPEFTHPTAPSPHTGPGPVWVAVTSICDDEHWDQTIGVILSFGYREKGFL